MYQGISQYVRQMAKAFVDLCHMFKEFGEIFSTIGVREPQPEASLTFSRFGEMHRSIEKKGIEMLKSIKVMMGDMNTFISKAVPDTRLTIKKYADVKFEYLVCLSVCLPAPLYLFLLLRVLLPLSLRLSDCIRLSRA